MTNSSPARPPLVLDEVVAASEEAGDYNAQDQAASTLVNCRVALSAEMAIRIGKATKTTPESWLSMQAKLDLWRAARCYRDGSKNYLRFLGLPENRALRKETDSYGGQEAECPGG